MIKDMKLSQSYQKNVSQWIIQNDTNRPFLLLDEQKRCGSVNEKSVIFMIGLMCTLKRQKILQNS